MAFLPRVVVIINQDPKDAIALILNSIGRDGMPTSLVFFHDTEAEKILGIVGVFCFQVINRFFGCQNLLRAPGGTLCAPPISQLTLERLIALDNQRSSPCSPELVGVDEPAIDHLAQDCKAFTVTTIQAGVVLVHPLFS